MYKANYHTHVKYCNHAIGDVIDYVKEAYNLGLLELGMSDHGPVLESFMNANDYKRTYCFEYMKLDNIDIYLNDIKKAQEEFKGKIKILSGFETEFLPKYIDHYKFLRSKVDYLNLGIHFYEFDNKIIDTYIDVNYDNVLGYLDTLKKAIDTNLFNTVVHPDLFLYEYKDKFGNNNFDERCEFVTRSIIEYCIKNNIYVEVNANGLKYSLNKSDRNMWRYPNVKFWQIAKEYKDLKILLGADAHNPKHLYNDNVKDVIKFIEDMGLNICEFMEINH